MQSPSSPPLLPGNRSRDGSQGPGPRRRRARGRPGGSGPRATPSWRWKQTTSLPEVPRQPQALVGPGSQPYVLQKRMREREREREGEPASKPAASAVQRPWVENLRPPPGSAPSWHFPVSVSLEEKTLSSHTKRGRPSSSVPTRPHPDALVQPRPEALRAPGTRPPAPQACALSPVRMVPAAVSATPARLPVRGSTPGTASLQGL